MTSFDVVSYERDDKEAYLELLEQAWDAQAMSQADFEWWFERNPAGSLMSVARRNGDVVGVASHSLFRMVLGGEERLASFSVHATTHASMRGQGVFRTLEATHEQQAKERGVAVVLAFASKPTAPIFLGPLGWTEIARLRMWARPILRRGLRTVPGEPFTGMRDRAADWPNHVIRDGEYLNWRYVDSPRGYRVVHGARGYAVVGRRGRVAILADLAGPPDELRRLVSGALREARDCSALVALAEPAAARPLLSLGFVPTPKSLHFMGKALAGRLDTDPRAWRFTLGDTDFF